MKTRIIHLALIILITGNNNYISATTFEIGNSGFTFTPDEITINLGDTINFNIGSSHNAVEVSEESWNAGDATSNGGFSLPFGGGQVVLEELGTYYYVCVPHVSLGMKGIIHVEEPTSIAEKVQVTGIKLKAYPNPASGMVVLSFGLVNTTEVKIELVEITGRIVRNFINTKLQPGSYIESFNLDNLPPGRYLIHIQTDTESKVEPLFIIE